MSKDAVDEVACHLFGGLRQVVECRDDGKDGGSGVGGQLHVAKVDAVKGSLAYAEKQRAIFFEADISSALDEICGEAVGD